MIRALLNALLMIATGLARTAPAQAASLTVLAASSLNESLPRAAAVWSAQGHSTVQFSFDASSRLAHQIIAGIPADVFFAADTDWMDEVTRQGATLPPSRVNVVGNQLVVVVPSRSASGITDTSALANPGVRHLAVANENVPAGKYARVALTRLGVWSAVRDRIVNGANARTVLAWVATGEADAGIVYATDAQIEPRVRVAFLFPRHAVSPIVYPAAVLSSSTNAAEAKSFLDFCTSEAGQAIFRAAGFLPAP